MNIFTQALFDLLPVNEHGVKMCSNGDYSNIKNFPAYCVFEGSCLFAAGSMFGEDCSFGSFSVFGANAFFDIECNFGKGCFFEHNCKFLKWCSFGSHCSFDSHCSFGIECRFKDHCLFDTGCYFELSCSFGDWCSFEKDCINENFLTIKKQNKAKKKKQPTNRLFRIGDKVHKTERYIDDKAEKGKVYTISCAPWRESYGMIYVQIAEEKGKFPLEAFTLIDE